MTAPPVPRDEERRLSALRALALLDTEPEERFDRITRLAQRLFGTQIAAVTLIDSDRQWLKSQRGPIDTESPRETAFCAHAIMEPERTLVVEDALEDERFADNPYVTGDPNIRFYAGAPIAAPGGEALGTLCVIDDSPRDASAFDEQALRDLAEMVEREIAAVSLALGDDLTGLSNRRGFDLLGEKVLRVAERLEMPVAVIYLDLDNMKPINDEYGHDAGDRALVEVARLLETILRRSDVIARVGGDEFAALLAGTPAANAPTAVARLRAGLEQRNSETDEPFQLALSVGIADAAPGEYTHLSELVNEADEKMLAEKRAKRTPAS